VFGFVLLVLCLFFCLFLFGLGWVWFGEVRLRPAPFNWLTARVSLAPARRLMPQYFPSFPHFLSLFSRLLPG
jgi:hypothetical protein